MELKRVKTVINLESDWLLQILIRGGAFDEIMYLRLLLCYISALYCRLNRSTVKCSTVQYCGVFSQVKAIYSLRTQADCSVRRERSLIFPLAPGSLFSDYCSEDYYWGALVLNHK